MKEMMLFTLPRMWKYSSYLVHFVVPRDRKTETMWGKSGVQVHYSNALEGGACMHIVAWDDKEDNLTRGGGWRWMIAIRLGWE
jgi:hypothetical protein